MRLVSTQQIPATFVTWRSRRGELMHTVICKATYSLTPVDALLAEKHEPLCTSDEHWEDSEERSLRVASDLAPFKRRADVVVVGAVFAPAGTTARRVIARIALGDIDKSFVAHCDRSADRDGMLVEGRPFSRMPIVYERARGGEETDNPVGRTSARNNVGQLVLPNLQPVAFEPEAPDFFVPSIGLGPIAAIWPSRTRRLGGHAALPPDALLERPEDFDASYFNVAPADQQLDQLPSNAHLVLESLSAEHPRLVTRLPGHRARALVERAGIDLNLVCDTLWIDTERGVCTLTWRGAFRADSPAADERIIVALEGGDMHMSADLLQKSVPSLEETQALRPRKTISLTERAALPFGGQPPAFASALAGTPFQPFPKGPSVSEQPPSSPRPNQHAPSAPEPPPSQPLQQLQPLQIISAPALAPPVSPHQPALPVQTFQAPAYLSAPRPPASVPTAVAHDARAAFLGAASASDAAARVNLEPAPRASTEVTNGSARQTTARPRTFVDLLWFDSGAVEQIRAQPAWTQILKGTPRGSQWLTEAASVEASKVELLPRTFVARAMTRVASLDAVGVQQAILNAVNEDGFLVRPLVVVEGELGLVYSPLEALRTSITLAEPLSATDKKLKEQLDAALDVAKPERKCSIGMIESALARLRTAFQAANKVYPPNYLETMTERSLIEERSYLKRVVLGGPKLIALLTPQSGAPLSIYLPEELADRLPLLARFRARLIAEPHARQDASDGEGTVLLALALGRIVLPST